MTSQGPKVFRIRKVKKWTKEEDELLIEIFNSKQRKNLNVLERNLKNKSIYDCLARLKKIDNKFKRGRWTREEDEKILKLIEKHGKKWTKLAQEMNTRSSKQIRDRYLNMLDENLNSSKFTLDEDILLFDLQRKYGNKWSFFTQFFKNRNADKLKNRFNSIRKNKKKWILILKSLEEKVRDETKFLNFYKILFFLKFINVLTDLFFRR